MARHVSNNPTEPNPELRRPQVTLKTTLTVCFGVCVVVAAVSALWHALVAVGLTGAAQLIAVSLDHAVRALERRRVNAGAVMLRTLHCVKNSVNRNKTECDRPLSARGRVCAARHLRTGKGSVAAGGGERPAVGRQHGRTETGENDPLE